MQVESILNRIENYKGFVYEQVRWSSPAGRPCLKVEVGARGGSRGRRSGCGEPGATYDLAQARWYEYVPLWGVAVVWVYAQRRVTCQRCGVKVQARPALPHGAGEESSALDWVPSGTPAQRVPSLGDDLHWPHRGLE